MADIKDYECVICLKLLYKPVSNSCGHNFCKPCIDQNLAYRNKCPICRADLSYQYSPNITLSNAINDLFPELVAERESQILSNFDRPQSQYISQFDDSNEFLPIYYTSSSSDPLFVGSELLIRVSSEEISRMIEYIISKGGLLIVVNKFFWKKRSIGTLAKINENVIQNVVPEVYQPGKKVSVIGLERVKLTFPTVKTSFNFDIVSYKVFTDLPFKSFDKNNTTPVEELKIQTKRIIDISEDAIYIASNPDIIKPKLNVLKGIGSSSNGYNRYLCTIAIINICLEKMRIILRQCPETTKKRFVKLHGDIPPPLRVDSEIFDVEKMSFHLCKIIFSTTFQSWNWFSSKDTMARVIDVSNIVLSFSEKIPFDILGDGLFPNLMRKFSPMNWQLALLIGVVIVSVIFERYNKRRL